MKQITDLNDLRLFVQVVDHGSFTAAARSLGAQTSKLSRRIRALEEELGVRLLNRTSRSLSLTETGRQFYQHCAALVAEAQAAKGLVEQTRTQPQGAVRISCPGGLLSSGIGEILAEYLEANPQVQVLLDATNRRVDVVEEGLDLAIRVRVPPLENTDLAVRPLGHSVRILVASPTLVATFPTPHSLNCLQAWPTLSMANDGEKYTWQLLDEQGQRISLVHQPRLATDDLTSLRSAVLRGIGVAVLPRELVVADIDAGRLVQVLPGVSTAPGLVHAIFPTRRGMVPAVRHLLDALVVGLHRLNAESEQGVDR
ncbi:LysR substrate-binding domain-containing protein [Pseudomonas sp. NBRC 111131]|uniref:LysR substrate-binding domain-containing protein n=1 Tax=Pseudomonas sp. NBRC 111131 TaxID=1661046 RepID=UPI0009EC82A5|nr:LysR substrate-binding domain-containing protein [Pseudomonas sp. NBRC 111131]